jgi:hypothetical protein
MEMKPGSRFGIAPFAGLVCATLLACSSSNPPADSNADAGSSEDAPPTVTIVRPTPNQAFKTTETITLEGTGIDAVEGDIGKAIDAKERMLWKISADNVSFNPAGEGPSDSIGQGTDHPTTPGTYTVRFDVATLRGQTGTAKVTIKIE